MLGSDGFQRWAQARPRPRGAVVRARGVVLPRLAGHDARRSAFARLGDWMGLGRLLYKGTWRSASLAVQFFDGSPQLFASMSRRRGAHPRPLRRRAVRPLVRPRLALPEHRPGVARSADRRGPRGVPDVRRGARLDRLGRRALVPREGPGAARQHPADAARPLPRRCPASWRAARAGRRSRSSPRPRAPSRRSTRSRTGCCFRCPKTWSMRSPLAAMEFLKTAVAGARAHPDRHDRRLARARAARSSTRARRAARPTSAWSRAAARRCWKRSRRASS